jgi:hypothetical protein
MIINDIQARRLLLPLYHTAEKDANDIIANAASALAVRLETARREYMLSELDQRIIRHAITAYNAVVDVVPARKRRKTYKRRVTLA